LGINKDFIVKNGLQVGEDVVVAGNITANNIIGQLQGNSETASTLETPRTITIGSTGKTFDGSSNVSWALNEIGVGTLGEQNTNTALITGGSIDGTTIGATTASTGAFTSVTTPLVTNAGTLALSATGANVVTASTNGAERLRIDSAGNVGIGTSSPLSLAGTNLSIEAASANVRLQLNSSGGSGRDYRIVSNTNGRLSFLDSTAGADRMVIDSAGLVGIGFNSPTSLLHLRGTGDVLRLDTSGSEDQDGVALRFHQRDTTIQNGQGYGGIEWEGSDANNDGVRGYIKGFAEGASGQFALAFATQGSGASSPVEQMRIDSEGRVGIGTSSPTRLIDAVGSALTIIRAATTADSAASVEVSRNNGALVARLQTGNTEAWVGSTNNVPFAFRTNNSERLRITAAGNVGIGTSSPEDPLTIIGTLRVGTSTTTSAFGLLSFGRSGASTGSHIFGDVSGNIRFANGTTTQGTSTERLRITSAGLVGIGLTNPTKLLDVNGVAGFRERIDLRHTASPSLRLFQENSSSTGNRELAIFNDNGLRLQTRTDTGTFVSNDYLIDTNENGALRHRFAIANSEMMRINSDTNNNAALIGIGTTSIGASLHIRSANSGISPSIVLSNPLLPITATGTTLLFDTINVSYAANTTAATLMHYRARPADSLGSGVTLTNQYGFFADNRMTQATNNMGFYSNLGIGTGRWNFYANGTAPNYFAGNVGIGTSSPSQKLDVFGNALIQGVITTQSFAPSITFTDLSPTADFRILGDQNALSTLIDTGSGFTEAMRITSAGLVGIGTTAPASRLDVSGGDIRLSTNATYLRSSDSAGTSTRMFGINAGNTTFIGPIDPYVGGAVHYGVAAGVSAHAFFTGATERLRITSAGRVGIGTSSPNSKLQVDATGGAPSTTASTTSINASLALSSGGAGTLGTGTQLFSGVGGSEYVWLQAQNTGDNSRKNISLNPVGGNVGIGNASPSDKLDIITSNNGSTTQGITFRNPNGWGSAINFNIPYAAVRLFTQNEGSGGRFMISTADASGNLQERARIDASGNLLIGTTTTGTTNAYFEVVANARSRLNLGSNTTTSVSVARFNNPNGTVGSITTSGSATTYATSSDYRLKEDVQPMVGSVDRLMTLKPVNFAWKADGSRVDGFIAHEAQDVVPEAVTGEKDAVDKDGNPEYQGIDQSKIVPLLTAALQEALTEIAALKERLDAANL
jgi:hypothetical protein